MATNINSETESAHQVAVDLIRACATTVVSEEQRSIIRRLAAECRVWTYVLEACRIHGVSSLVCQTMEATAPDLVPQEIREILQARFRANAYRNLFLTQELLRLVQGFHKNGIEVIPFKGPLLAITTYGNVALREFLDLDVLVTKNDFRRARALLADLGYRPPVAQAGQPSESFFKSQLGSDYIRDDGRVALEVHWSFVQTWLGFHVDLQAIWAKLQPVHVGSVSVLNLPADTTLLYLCAHGAKHRWSRLCWVVDIAELLRRQSKLDWDALLAQAASSGCRRTFFIGLKLAQSLLGAAVPKYVMARIEQDQEAILLAQTLGDGMFNPERDFIQTQFGWDRDLYHIRTKERWREKLIYLSQLAVWGLQPSDKDRAWVSLPGGFHWLYVFIRPIRVACQARQTTVDAL
jgi:hypothetical protein